MGQRTIAHTVLNALVLTRVAPLDARRVVAVPAVVLAACPAIVLSAVAVTVAPRPQPSWRPPLSRQPS
jgi:hypothetical protein